MKLLLYCTKAKPYLYFAQEARTLMEIDNSFEGYRITNKNVDDSLNGKIVAECDFEVEKIEKGYGTHHASFDEKGCFDDYYDYMTKTIDEDVLLKRSCLNIEELETYNPNYAIHINNLKIFDEPKKITAYHCKTNKNDELCLNGGCGYKFFYKAPQNMMKVYDHWGKGNDYILISVRPEWLCKILNGEKTIEVRKKVLREMIK